MLPVPHEGVSHDAVRWAVHHLLEEVLLEAGSLLPLGLVQAGGQGAQVEAQRSHLPAQLLASLRPATVHKAIVKPLSACGFSCLSMQCLMQVRTPSKYSPTNNQYVCKVDPEALCTAGCSIQRSRRRAVSCLKGASSFYPDTRKHAGDMGKGNQRQCSYGQCRDNEWDAPVLLLHELGKLHIDALLALLHALLGCGQV